MPPEPLVGFLQNRKEIFKYHHPEYTQKAALDSCPNAQNIYMLKNIPG